MLVSSFGSVPFSLFLSLLCSEHFQDSRFIQNPNESPHRGPHGPQGWLPRFSPFLPGRGPPTEPVARAAPTSHPGSLLLVTFPTHSCLRSLPSAIPLPTLLLPVCHPLGKAPLLPTPELDSFLWSVTSTCGTGTVIVPAYRVVVGIRWMNTQEVLSIVPVAKSAFLGSWSLGSSSLGGITGWLMFLWRPGCQSTGCLRITACFPSEVLSSALEIHPRENF